MTENSISSDLLVVGGGIAGITAAVEDLMILNFLS